MLQESAEALKKSQEETACVQQALDTAKVDAPAHASVSNVPMREAHECLPVLHKACWVLMAACLGARAFTENNAPAV